MASEYSYTDDHVMPGTQLGDNMSFKSRNHEEIRVTPIMVDFGRLLQNNTSVEVVKGVLNRDLLHAAVGLYDVSLSDMTPDVLYSSVCNKWARTIMLLREFDATLRDVEARWKSQLVRNTDSVSPSTDDSLRTADDGPSFEEAAETESNEDVFLPEEKKPSTFSTVFSDTEEEEDDDDGDDGDAAGNDGDDNDHGGNEEEEEDYSKGINSFLKSVAQRKKQFRNRMIPPTVDDVGIENRIVAALTFEKKFVNGNEKVVHLTLISVRQRYRKCGVGKYLIQLMKSPSVVGPFDAVVVHADNSAVAFFTKYGFSDDVILNKRWSELAEQYTHCTLMCYLPTFTKGSGNNSAPELDLMMMENEIRKWRSRCVDAYQAEVSCMVRMRQEIVHLRAVVGSQQDAIERLAAKNEQLELEKFKLTKDLMQCRLVATMKRLENLDCRRVTLNGHSLASSEDDSDLEDLIKELKEAQLDKSSLGPAEVSNSGSLDTH